MLLYKILACIMYEKIKETPIKTINLRHQLQHARGTKNKITKGENGENVPHLIN